MKAFLTCALLSGLVLLTGGCGRQQADAGSAEGKAGPRIAVIPKGTSHVFWQSVHAGAAKAASETGASILWNGPANEGQREEQFRIVEDMIARGVNGIVLAPLDAKALVPAIEQAAQAKIPVVIFDSGAETDSQVSFVATDNYQGGVKAAEQMAALLGGKGDVLLVRYNPGSDSTMNREKGFEETLAAKWPEIRIVASEYGKTTVATALAVVEDMLAKTPEFDGIFACNESTAVGTLRALQNHKKAGNVKFVGFDTSPTLVEALEKGEIDALIAQNPFRMGEEGVKAVVAHIQGKPVEKRIDTGVAVVTRENMAQPEIAALLDIELVRKWLE